MTILLHLWQFCCTYRCRVFAGVRVIFLTVVALSKAYFPLGNFGRATQSENKSPATWLVKVGSWKNSPRTSRKRSYFFVCSRDANSRSGTRGFRQRLAIDRHLGTPNYSHMAGISLDAWSKFICSTVGCLYPVWLCMEDTRKNAQVVVSLQTSCYESVDKLLTCCVRAAGF